MTLPFGFRGCYLSAMLAVAIVRAGEGTGLVGQEGSLTVSDNAELRIAPVVLDYDEPPRLVKITRPEYPRRASERGVEGRVLVEILIDRSGRVAKAKVVESIPELDEAALACVKTWRFKPAKKAGRAIPARAQAPVVFRRDLSKDKGP